VLVCDLPHADELLVEVFKDFFTLSKLNLPATVEAFMADILTALIDEAQSVLNEVLEILLAQFNAKKIVGLRLLSRFALRVTEEFWFGLVDRLRRTRRSDWP